jgi:hypothetical protein
MPNLRSIGLVDFGSEACQPASGITSIRCYHRPMFGRLGIAASASSFNGRRSWRGGLRHELRTNSAHVWTAPAVQEVFLTFRRGGRVRAVHPIIFIDRGAPIGARPRGRMRLRPS